MTVAHFLAVPRSHLGQVILPLRVTSLPFSPAWLPVQKNRTRPRPRSNVPAIRMGTSTMFRFVTDPKYVHSKKHYNWRWGEGKSQGRENAAPLSETAATTATRGAGG